MFPSIVSPVANRLSSNTMSRYDMGHCPFYDHPWGYSKGHFQFPDQHYRRDVDMDHYVQPVVPFQWYDRPRSHLNGEESGKSSVVMNKDGFKMTVDVQHFKPEEITVKLVEDSVVVEAKHKETDDEQFFASRNFLRRYALPEGVDAHALTSAMSWDGVLTITAPKVKQMDSGNVHSIPIKQTGKPAIPGAKNKATEVKTLVQTF